MLGSPQPPDAACPEKLRLYAKNNNSYASGTGVIPN